MLSKRARARRKNVGKKPAVSRVADAIKPSNLGGPICSERASHRPIGSINNPPWWTGYPLRYPERSAEDRYRRISVTYSTGVTSAVPVLSPSRRTDLSETAASHDTRSPFPPDPATCGHAPPLLLGQVPSRPRNPDKLPTLNAPRRSSRAAQKDDLRGPRTRDARVSRGDHTGRLTSAVTRADDCRCRSVYEPTDSSTAVLAVGRADYLFTSRSGDPARGGVTQPAAGDGRPLRL